MSEDYVKIGVEMYDRLKDRYDPKIELYKKNIELYEKRIDELQDGIAVIRIVNYGWISNIEIIVKTKSACMEEISKYIGYNIALNDKLKREELKNSKIEQRICDFSNSAIGKFLNFFGISV